MSIKTILILLMVVYLATVVFNSLRISNTAPHVTGPFFFIFSLFLVYSVLTIMLTVKLNHAGAFQWIVASATIKKLVLIIGVASILYAFFSSMMIKSEWVTYSQQSIAKPKDFLAYTSYIWMPLLMIVPYTLAIYKSDQAFTQSIAFKVPLIINIMIGLFTYMFFHSYYFRALFG